MAKGETFDILSMLNDVSREDASKTKRILIDYTALVPNKNNHYSITGITELADSIENVGLLQDLLVKPLENNSNQYLIISGHRRYEAVKLLVEERSREDLRKIHCIVDETNEEDIMSRMKLHLANMTIRDMTEYDKMIAIEEIEKIVAELKNNGVVIKGRVRDLIAENIGLSPRQVQTYTTVNNNATDEVKKSLKEGSITLTEAYEKTPKKNVAVTATCHNKMNEVIRLAKKEKAKYMFQKVKSFKKISDELDDSTINSLVDRLGVRLQKLMK